MNPKETGKLGAESSMEYCDTEKYVSQSRSSSKRVAVVRLEELNLATKDKNGELRNITSCRYIRKQRKEK